MGLLRQARSHQPVKDTETDRPVSIQKFLVFAPAFGWSSVFLHNGCKPSLGKGLLTQGRTVTDGKIGLTASLGDRTVKFCNDEH